MRPVVEPLTSLLIRELRIMSAKFGQVSRCADEMARALRLHLQSDVNNARMAPNKGQSGAEAADDPQSDAPLLPGLVEPEILSREYD